MRWRKMRSEPDALLEGVRSGLQSTQLLKRHRARILDAVIPGATRSGEVEKAQRGFMLSTQPQLLR